MSSNTHFRVILISLIAVASFGMSALGVARSLPQRRYNLECEHFANISRAKRALGFRTESSSLSEQV
ncbi:unnamed protein product [Colias eurytheme]|nr:unnamed protein product [Colias eurytheme]